MSNAIRLRPTVFRQVAYATAALAALAGHPAAAQDLNVMLPIPEVEARLRDRPFTILDWRGSRRPEDRTQRVTLSYEDSVVVLAKWANAPPNGGGRFNNEPRYEVAAYELQKLFLDEPDYVVPPTLLRAVPIELVRQHMPKVKPTFNSAPGSVLIALQYWLSAVTAENFYDPERARSDTIYARHVGDFNIVTYLIHHSDANTGNYLVSTVPESPRVFSVDNGLSFSSEDSNRGTQWRELLVERFPRRTIERLKELKREQLEGALAVLAEYEVRDSVLVPVPVGPNLAKHSGVRRKDSRIQLGLTEREIRDVEYRIRQLVGAVSGRRLF